MDKLPSQIIADAIRRYMRLGTNDIWLRDQNRDIPEDDGLYVVVGLVNSTDMSAESSIRQAQDQDWDTARGCWDVAGQVYDYSLQPVRYDAPGQVWDKIGQTFDQQAIAVVETIRVQRSEIIQIDILSRGNDILSRNWEIVGALRSIYCQQQQEKYNFKIMRLTRGLVNTSSAEGGSELNRYTITIPVFVWYMQETLLAPDGETYYDSFGVRVDDEQTIGSKEPLQYDTGGAYDQPGEVYDQPLPIIEFEIGQEGIT